MYAVLETGSKQYRVAAGDKLEIERLDTEAGKTFTFDKVLLVSNDGKVTIVTPSAADADAMRKAMAPIYRDMSTRVGKDVVDAYLKTTAAATH